MADPLLKPPTRSQPVVARYSIRAGNGMQLAGTVLGLGLVWTALHGKSRSYRRTVGMVTGWSAVYLSSHACAHWAVGRMVGIEFQDYAIQLGTANPEQYPVGMRSVMRRLPFWSVRTEPRSRRAAGRWPEALMFAAGDTSTTVCTLAIAYASVRHRVPWSRMFAAVMVGWSAIKTMATLHNEKGDYAKARTALRRRPQSAVQGPLTASGHLPANGGAN